MSNDVSFKLYELQNKVLIFLLDRSIITKLCLELKQYVVLISLR